MNIVRCPNNRHFYDAEKFSCCPHCAEGRRGDEDVTSAFNVDETIPLFEGQDVSVNGLPSKGNVILDSTYEKEFPIYTLPEAPNSWSVPELQENEDLTEDLGEVTQSFFGSELNIKLPTKSDLEETGYQEKKVTEPCVGWLIALGGIHLGRDYRLVAGKNFIGRDSKMDIALENERSVSREKHAVVIYEPKESVYLLQPGEAKTLVYRNEKVALETLELEAYDVISVGNINLLFIPLFNKEFSWTDLLEHMHKSNGE